MSPKSVAQKLLIKPGTTLWSSGPEHLDLVEPLPDGVPTVDAIADATTVVVFAGDANSLYNVLEAHKDHLARPSVLWIAYPKGNRTDVNRDTLWPILGQYGMRPITQISVDEVWSALRFRLLREDEAPLRAGP